MSQLLPLRTAEALLDRPRSSISPDVLAATAEIIARTEAEGEAALRSLGEEHDGLGADDPMVIEAPDLARALEDLDAGQRALLERSAEHIRRFASAQRDSLQELNLPIAGGRAGHRIAPIQRVGCYVPAGRHPLPSSLLMTVCTAKVAGVPEVWVASPKPSPLMLATAALAGADSVLALGGAQAMSALALGIGPVPACDMICGPGNAWVTAAKQLLAGRVSIDMLAGPSELLIIADDSADPRLVAADLIAQAEHDPLARPYLLSDDPALIQSVRSQLEKQLQSLPTADVARSALLSGSAISVADMQEALALADRIAPEHLQLMTLHPEALGAQVQNYGSLFLGSAAGEVLADYGAGPNHVLPTEARAMQRGGLSVFDFIRINTWMQLEAGSELRALARDAAALASLEGLPGHARAALMRAEFHEGASPNETRHG
ncbi:MAG: histidinol dehydrogenase [Planctomycetota bacterium]|jgi:phosphoribosyl-ATP pyrophosphohydrolase/phosphoribosyl-AMP cyclohydrolase/histidinol dehydrogenase